MNIKKKYTSWIFNSFSVSPEGLGLYRIFTALFILLFLLPSAEMYQFLGSAPDAFYTPPPGPMMLFDSFPVEEVFWGLHAVLIIALLCLLVGYKTSMASLLTGIIFFVIKGFFYSIGKINHDMLLSIVPIVMAFSGWGMAYSVDSIFKQKKHKKATPQSWPLVLLALFLGFMMFTAGFPKLLGGWLYPDTQATLGHFFNQYHVKGRQDLLATWIVHLDNRMLWELMDYATVFFEMSFLIAVFHPRTTRLFVSFAILFHFSIMMTLNISFLPNFPAYAAFLNWRAINSSFKKWINSKWASPAVVFFMFLILGMISLIGSRYDVPHLQSDLQVHEFYILLLALPIALTYVVRQIISLFDQIMSLSKQLIS